MTQRLFRIAAVALLTVVAAPAAAQDWSRPDPKAEPWRDARLRIGPLFFNPTFQIKDLGVDQNVFNDVPGAERRDLTGTLSMTSQAGLQVRRLLVTAQQNNSYIWFRTYTSERSVDGSLKVVGELRLGALRPWAAIERSESHARGFEIDARAGRQAPAWEFGSDIQFGWRIGATGAYRKRSQRYAEGERFEDVELREVLDYEGEEFRGHGRLQLTDFTSAVGGVDYFRMRFDRAAIRNSDDVYYFAGLESTAESRLGLNLKIGWMEQRHKDPAVQGFSGVVASGSTTFVVADVMQLRFGADRRIGLSYLERYPYYIEAGGDARTTIRFMPQFDLRFDAQLRWLSYRNTVTGTEDPRQDRSLVLGGEFGYFLGGTSGSRVGIRYEYAERTSPVALKKYKRSRFYSQFSLSF